MTVIEFANKCLKDKEVLSGGVIKNERRYLDDIGFSYTVAYGQVDSAGEDLAAFYDAIFTIIRLDKKYHKEA